MTRLSSSDAGGVMPVLREWLVTNGLGGYAMGTVDGARARGYHGMLVAALQPPVGRWLMVGGVADSVQFVDRAYRLTGEARVSSAGHHELIPPARELSFTLDDGVPVWTLSTSHGRLEKRVFMAHGQNTTYLRYTLRDATDPALLHGTVAAAFRDHHQLGHHGDGATDDCRVERIEHGLRVRLGRDAAWLQLLSADLQLNATDQWLGDEYLAIEDERGLACREDEHVVADFECLLSPGRSVTLVLSAEPTPDLDGEHAYAVHLERQTALLDQADLQNAPEPIRQLVRAADSFLVRRPLDDGTLGHTVIAGYPWFGDWGRDTMIALPGLTLATGRVAEARGILTTFARYLDRGMLPNRFPDGGEAPEYNTADATLWYVEAVRAYHAATGDDTTVRALFDTLDDIVAHHLVGTRDGIGVDPADGLLRAGVPGANLTWMDAKVDGVVITPRHGKPVELSALWINALTVVRDLAGHLGEPDTYSGHLARASVSFARFWDEASGHLRDVLDPADATLRPNQLVAAMLPSVPLTAGQRRSIVDACRAALLTPYGLRTLPPDHPSYRGRFVGGPQARDAMYHQGPAWSWLLGPFLSAHLRAYGDPATVRVLLDAALAGLDEGCLGSVSELFDGDPPHRPRGACAQAWGVAELLRVWRQLEQFSR